MMCADAQFYALERGISAHRSAGGRGSVLVLGLRGRRAICDSVICSFALRSARFSLIDLADFWEWWTSCGDLSPMASSVVEGWNRRRDATPVGPAEVPVFPCR